MPAGTGSYRVPLTAATTTAVGGVLKVQNPENADVIITRLVLDVQKPSSGAATVDAGIDDDGDTSSDNLIDGLDVNAAAGVFDNLGSGGTNGLTTVLWPAGHHLVITASADATGLEGDAHVQYVRR